MSSGPTKLYMRRGTEENCRDLAAKSHYHILKLEKQKKTVTLYQLKGFSHKFNV